MLSWFGCCVNNAKSNKAPASLVRKYTIEILGSYDLNHQIYSLQETVAKMEDSKVWRLENEFYEFARAHFDFVREEFEQSGGKGAKRHFHYEKIRPR